MNTFTSSGIGLSNPDAMIEEDEYEDIFFLPNPNRTRPKISSEVLWESAWGQMLRNPETRDPRTFYGKKWITRFRVPFPVFETIVEMCERDNIFQIKRTLSMPIPVPFRVLVSLRMLGKNHDFDTLNELSLIGASTCHVIFVTFVTNFVKKYFHKLVNIPQGEELRAVMEVYKIMGFNGCFGSIDCTHIHWNKCKKQWQNFCIGKEGYPTLSFLVVVDHNRRAMVVSDAFFGACNDKMIVKNVEETKALMSGSMEHIPYLLYDAQGQLIKVQGAYLIADAGFLRVGCMIDPTHAFWSQDEVRWSEFLESIRKDVECFFGILKNRFRYCLGPIETRDFSVIESAFKCCAMLHNMILDYDRGFHEKCSVWENIDWETLDPDAPDDLIEEMLHESREQRMQESVVPFLPVPADATQATVIIANNEHDHMILKELLITSFTQQFKMGQVYWPRRFQGWQKDALALKRVISRFDQECFHALYEAPSTSLAMNRVTGVYNVSLGPGLFSTLN
jgi:hypothetical protein